MKKILVVLLIILAIIVIMLIPLKDRLDISNLKGDIVFLQKNDSPTGRTLFTIQADGSNMKKILDLQIPMYNPKWSDDGNTITFSTGILPINENDKTDEVLDGGAYEYSITKEGTDLELIGLEGDTLTYDTKSDLLTIGDGTYGDLYYTDTTGEKKLLFSSKRSPLDSSTGNALYEAILTPDNEHVLLTHNGDMYIIETSTSNKAFLTKGNSPDWK